MATMKKHSRKKKLASMDERFPMNINQDLFDTWQQLKRKGDPKELCKELKLSRPIIDRALKYGHVKNPITADRISKFFSKRVEFEKANPEPPLTKNSKKLIETVK